MKNHSFNIELATKLQSIEKAVILENMSFWITKNLANDSNIHGEDVYTYNSYDALQELFPYMKLNTLKRAIRELEADGIIKSRTDLNKNKWDKTKWYTIVCEDTQKHLFTDDEIAKLSIVKKITIEEENNNHRQLKKQPSLIGSNINTDINTDNKPKEKNRPLPNKDKSAKQRPTTSTSKSFETFISDLMKAFKEKKILTWQTKINKTERTQKAFKQLDKSKLQGIISLYAEHVKENTNYAKRLDVFLIAYLEGNLELIGTVTPKQQNLTSQAYRFNTSMFG